MAIVSESFLAIYFQDGGLIPMSLQSGDLRQNCLKRILSPSLGSTRISALYMVLSYKRMRRGGCVRLVNTLD